MYLSIPLKGRLGPSRAQSRQNGVLEQCWAGAHFGVEEPPFRIRFSENRTGTGSYFLKQKNWFYFFFMKEMDLEPDKVTRPITNHLSMTEHFGRIFLNSSPFWVIQNVLGSPSQALQIIFEMESQKTSQKIAVKKIRFFELQNCFFFLFFFHFDSLYFQTS